MKLLYDEDLLEGVVQYCAGRPNGVLSPAQVARFHRERERLYGIADADERNAAFFALHLAAFREWGLEQSIKATLAEFPLLPNALAVLAFRKTLRKGDEGAELFVHTERGRHGVVALRVERFEKVDELERFLRRELMHLQDMVDPQFAYTSILPAASGGTQRLALERYRLLWNITIEGRLSQHGRNDSGAREIALAELDRAFGFWPEARRRDAFEQLWTNPSPSHADLMAIAADPRQNEAASRPFPGGACPLCGFPAFQWAEPHALTDAILSAVQRDFPAWTADSGICARCLEIYHSAGRPLPPTIAALNAENCQQAGVSRCHVDHARRPPPILGQRRLNAWIGLTWIAESF